MREEKREQPKEYRLNVENDYAQFVPGDFKRDPFEYFEQQGVNIKPGEKIVDATGRVREDPTAVKEFPAWQDFSGHQITAVGKRVNTEKSEVRHSGNPFYEYDLLKKLEKAGLPAAKPIAKYEENGNYLFVTEKIPGLPANQNSLKKLRDLGWTDKDIDQLKTSARQMMSKMQVRYAKAGFVRNWNLTDMVLQLDQENKTLKSLVPTDWEKTKYTGA